MTQKQVFTWLFGGAIFLLLVFSLAGYFGAIHVYLDAVSNFKLQYFVLGLCALFFFALTRQVRWSVVSLVLVLINLAVLLPWYVPDSTPPSPGAVPVRLLFANVYANNTTYNRLKTLIRNERPDIIALAEVTPAWQDALAELDDVYPYALAGVGPGQAGMLMYSALPLTPLSDLGSLGLSNRELLGARVDWEGVPFVAIAVHPLPPITPGMFEARNRFLETVGTYAGDRLEPVVMIGDFNVSLWSPLHQQFSRTSGLRNARRGFGILPSWPVHRFPLLIPIDHCFVSDEVHVRTFRTGPRVGSDHLPIIADLSIPQL